MSKQWRTTIAKGHAVPYATRPPWTPFQRVAEAEGNVFHLAPDEICFKNSRYQVVYRECGPGAVHLSIKRLDRAALHDWRDLQRIKNELIGKECEALELYPAESRLVDVSNNYHLWCYTEPGFRIPVGWDRRLVSERQIHKARQRPFEEPKPADLLTLEQLQAELAALRVVEE